MCILDEKIRIALLEENMDLVYKPFYFNPGLGQDDSGRKKGFPNPQQHAMWIHKENPALREMQISSEVSTSSKFFGPTKPCQFDLSSEAPSAIKVPGVVTSTCAMCTWWGMLTLKLQPRQYTYKFAGKIVKMVPQLREETLSLPNEVLQLYY